MGLIARAMRKCSKCGETKAMDEYPIKKGYVMRSCYGCCAKMKTKSDRKRRYGLSDADFENMFLSQAGNCALCKEPFLNGDVVVDHSHTTGKVRGILHRTCNTVLGHAKDRIEILNLAVDYLDLHREKANGR